MLAELERAVKSRNEAWVKLILEKEPRLDSPEGGRILWLAVLDDELEIASMLVRAGADLDARRPGSALGESLLHFLVGSFDPRHRGLALLMLDHGADVEARDERATSVLSRVLEAKHSDVNLVGELLLRGAPVGSEELFVAAEHPNAAELLPLLVRLGFVDDESRRERAEIALYFACGTKISESKSLAAAKGLLDLKLPLRKCSGQIAGALIRAVTGDRREVVRLILDRVGVDVNVRPSCGPRPLHFACKFGSLEMVKLLLRRGADLNAVDNFGNTPFSRIPDLVRLSDKSQLGIKHLVLMSTVKGRAINERNRAIIENSVEMKTFHDGCLEELRMMRLTIFFNSFTFFDVLASDVRRLSFLARNRDFVESFKGYPRERKFPTFCGDLEKIFEDAESRKERLLEKEVALREELVNVLPYVPLEKIVFYLYLNEEIDLKD